MQFFIVNLLLPYVLSINQVDLSDKPNKHEIITPYQKLNVYPLKENLQISASEYNIV